MAKKNKARTLLNRILKDRPQPQSPRAGYKASGSRYENGGKATRKKSI